MKEKMSVGPWVCGELIDPGGPRFPSFYFFIFRRRFFADRAGSLRNLR